MTGPPKKWARTATTAQARYRSDDDTVLDSLDVEFIDSHGAVLRVVRLKYLQPHAPALSEVMTDIATTVENRARMRVDPTSYRLLQDATTVNVSVMGDSV